MGQNIHKKTKKNLFKANSKAFDVVRFVERNFGFDFIWFSLEHYLPHI